MSVERLAALIDAARATRDDAEGIAEILLASGVWLPPEGATKSEGRYVTITEETRHPGWGSEVTVEDDGRVFAAGLGEITEEYSAWLATLPGTQTVTFEWADEGDRG